MSQVDIYSHRWEAYNSIGNPQGNITALKLFQDSVVAPALQRLQDEIRSLTESEDHSAVFFIDSMQDLYQSTIEGFVLTIQSMWERGLRASLIERDGKLNSGGARSSICAATWGGQPRTNLHRFFKQLFGLPLSAFDSYQDLDLLHNLGSAIRHGDGRAAKIVHDLAPCLWEPTESGPEFFACAGWREPAPSFDSIRLGEHFLKQMVLSVCQFWEDMENIRCNSFSAQHRSTQRRLDAWQHERQLRLTTRLWPLG